MARPVKNRIIQSMPRCEGVLPLGYDDSKEYENVIMTVDEFEAIRLIDYEGANQESCAESMGISRSTVTNIYESARVKLADALINEKILLIEGGNYDIIHKNRKIGKLDNSIKDIKIAVTYDGCDIFQHFGQCEEFKIYNVSEGRVVSTETARPVDYAHGALVGFIKRLGVNVLICGGIGGGAQDLLAKEGIRFFAGITGSADEAVNRLLEGKLEYNMHATCEQQKTSCTFQK